MKTKSHPRKRAFGPGTVAMLTGIAAFAAYGFFTKTEPPKSVYFEADSSGQLKQVERPSYEKAPLPSLWKPEPEILIQHRLLLKLTKPQAIRIESLSADWEAKKSDLLRRMDGATTEIRGQKTSTAVLQAGLGSYAELSRLYDQTRNSYWTAATAELDSKQLALIQKIRSGEVRP